MVTLDAAKSFSEEMREEKKGERRKKRGQTDGYM